MPTSPAHDTPSLSRQNSRTGRHHYRATDAQRPQMATRPSADRRDSSPLRTLATYGLLASGAGIAAAAPLRPPEAHELQNSGGRMQEDGLRAMQMLNRDLRENDMRQALGRQASPLFFDYIDWDQLAGDEAESSVTYSPIGSRPQSPLLARRSADVVEQSDTGAVQWPAANQPQQVPAIVSQAPTATQLQATAVPTPSAGATLVPADAQLFAGIGAGQNALAIVWNGDYAATFHAYANAGPYQPGLGEPYKSVVVQPGGYELMALPQGWAGRVQLMSGSVGQASDPATWAEMTFQGWKALTWFDVSAIRGINAGLSMRASDGSSQASIPANILEQAPQQIKMQDSDGRWVIKDTETYTGTLNQDAIDWLKQDIPAGDAYIRNFDNAATRATSDQHLVLEFSV